MGHFLCYGDTDLYFIKGYVLYLFLLYIYPLYNYYTIRPNLMSQNLDAVNIQNLHTYRIIKIII